MLQLAIFSLFYFLMTSYFCVIIVDLRQAFLETLISLNDSPLINQLADHLFLLLNAKRNYFYPSFMSFCGACVFSKAGSAG